MPATSVRAGTIFHHSKLPLTTWFLGIFCMTQSKNAIAALELMRTHGRAVALALVGSIVLVAVGWWWWQRRGRRAERAGGG